MNTFDLPAGWRSVEGDEFANWTEAQYVDEREHRIEDLARLPLRVLSLLALSIARRAIGNLEKVEPNDTRIRAGIIAAEKWCHHGGEFDYLATELAEEQNEVIDATFNSVFSREFTYYQTSEEYDTLYAAHYSAEAATCAIETALMTSEDDASTKHVTVGFAARALYNSVESEAYSFYSKLKSDTALFASEADLDGLRSIYWLIARSTYLRALGPEIPFRPEWRTPTAVAIAQGIAQCRASDRMPILADALMDAGFDHDDTIQYLQRQKGPHLNQADWVLWNLLELGGPV